MSNLSPRRWLAVLVLVGMLTPGCSPTSPTTTADTKSNPSSSTTPKDTKNVQPPKRDPG
jgi:hypothetical protein